MPRKETLPLEQLDLDVINPRFTPGSNQTDAMVRLLSVENDGEKVFALASDICRVGMLDPGDRLYVMESTDVQGRYIVLDGNRRLTALRLLSQPSLLDRQDIGISSVICNRFKRLQTEYQKKWPTEVDVVIFADRSTANHFIRLRHTGENAGAGRSAWSALQVARFDNTGTWQCIEQLRNAKKLTLEVTNKLDASSFEITNFERVVEKSEFQSRFDFSLTKTSFALGKRNSRAMMALAIVARDVAKGRVHTRGEFETAKTMQQYFDEVGAQIPTENKQGEENSASSNGAHNQSSMGQGQQPNNNGSFDSKSKESEPATDPQSPARKKRTPKYLVGKTELTTVSHQKCREIVAELKEGVEVERAPYACALLVRSLQEMTAAIYLEKMNQPVTNNKTTSIDQAAKHLLGNKHPTDPQDKQTLAKSFNVSGQVYDQLCEAAHSTVNEISPAHVRTTWNSLSGGLDLLWKRIYAEEKIEQQNRISAIKGREKK